MKKLKYIIIVSMILFLLIISIENASIAMTHYQTVGTTTGIVTATGLNIRQGPRNKF